MDSLTYWPTDQMDYSYNTGSSSYFSSSSQAGFPCDLPELYHDQTWPSPTSATSSNFISTPPADLQQQMAWQNASTKSLPYYPPSEWHESSTRPSIAPIDTNCNWKQEFNPHRAAEQPSILFTPLENFDAIMQSFSQQTSSFPQSSLPETGSNFRFSPPSLTSSPATTTDTISQPKFSPGVSALRKPKRTRSPGSQIHHPAGLKIYQPRPSRQIPIISLSKLAAACDRIPIQSRAKKSKSGNSNTRSSLSSTSFVGVTHPSYNHHSVHTQSVQMGLPNVHAKSNACHCGCML